MNLLVMTLSIYLLSLIVFFIFMYRGEKKEAAEKNTNEKFLLSTVIGALVLSLIPTAVIIVIILFATGSANVLVSFFELEIEFKQIVITSVCMVVYSFTFDNIFLAVGRHLIGDNFFKFIFASLFRFLFIYIVGILCSIGNSDNFKLSLGLTLFFLLLECIFPKKSDRAQNLKS
ncbi:MULTISPECIES: hypothetical protein [Bacillus]|uniref:hypothetical protein n=1 Tax=Bacillus TaxID=1386 RepID=UPI0006AE2951|nr:MULTISPECIES: hypothetical protein [Bacillus]AWD87849.1 hypothetical protein BVQ_10400 [Bacillus velezensis]AWM52017.1 hypothetical protein DDT10_10130 [Bacillus amyloliquefaciens]KAF6689655.1 hypothetical protein G9362_19110 [Bacillus sp. EKM601B]KOS52141.1 hypothetical protein AN272_04130 [Bacillus amyloliquefaciens]MBA9150378.1 hypothetical protein [Bacillus sp. EKM213B]